MDFDGEKLFELLLLSSMPNIVKRMVKVFTKRGISIVQAMEILMELRAISGDATNDLDVEGDDNGKGNPS